MRSDGFPASGSNPISTSTADNLVLECRYAEAIPIWIPFPEDVVKSHRDVWAVFVVIAVVILVMTVPAYAYIDPNAAGLVSQILTPLLVAGAAAFTFFRKQIAALFSGITRRFRRGADV